MRRTLQALNSGFLRSDILFGKLRPYFCKVIRPSFDGVCSTDVWVVRPKQGIDQGYFYYWLGFKRLREVCNSWFCRMNETLEGIARSIFKSWFVDFDPVRVKVEGRDLNLPDESTALFPAAFEVFGAREISKGRRVKQLSDLEKWLGGATPSTKKPGYWKRGTITWATPKNLSASENMHLLSTDRKITNVRIKENLFWSSFLKIPYSSHQEHQLSISLTTCPTAISQGFIALHEQ